MFSIGILPALAAPAIAISIETCMRQSELAGPTWDRVKLKGPHPTVRVHGPSGKRNHGDYRPPHSCHAGALCAPARLPSGLSRLELESSSKPHHPVFGVRWFPPQKVLPPVTSETSFGSLPDDWQFDFHVAPCKHFQPFSMDEPALRRVIDTSGGSELLRLLDMETQLRQFAAGIVNTLRRLQDCRMRRAVNASYTERKRS
jgi:hypothetical protein